MCFRSQTTQKNIYWKKRKKNREQRKIRLDLSHFSDGPQKTSKKILFWIYVLGPIELEKII